MCLVIHQARARTLITLACLVIVSGVLWSNAHVNQSLDERVPVNGTPVFRADVEQAHRVPIERPRVSIAERLGSLGERDAAVARAVEGVEQTSRREQMAGRGDPDTWYDPIECSA